MNKKNDLKILKFPNNIAQSEKQVEAILFAADEPLDEESIRERLKTRVNISKILNSLEKQYKNRGINLVCIAKKWSFRTASNLSKFMNLQSYTKKKLSKAAIETLAIIVYHQPVTRSEIEEIRGVSFATGTLEILLELNWVRPSGRKNVPGKPIQYITTDDFLSHFNLQKLSDLPNVEELGSTGLIDNSNIDTTIFGTGKLYKEKMEEKKENLYSNIDDMLNQSLKSEEEE
jgi:segregation and condensation protein B